MTRKVSPANPVNAKKLKRRPNIDVDSPLSPKQQAFVNEYLVDLNAAKAAVRAGYSAKSASVQAADMMSWPKILNAISERMQEREVRTEITQDRVLKEIARVAFFDIRRLYRADSSPLPISELDDDTAAALAGLDIHEEFETDAEGNKVFIGYTKKYRMNGKVEALTLAGRHLGMWNDKLQVDVRNGLADRLADARQRVKERRSKG